MVSILTLQRRLYMQVRARVRVNRQSSSLMCLPCSRHARGPFPQTITRMTSKPSIDRSAERDPLPRAQNDAKCLWRCARTTVRRLRTAMQVYAWCLVSLQLPDSFPRAILSPGGGHLADSRCATFRQAGTRTHARSHSQAWRVRAVAAAPVTCATSVRRSSRPLDDHRRETCRRVISVTPFTARHWPPSSTHALICRLHACLSIPPSSRVRYRLPSHHGAAIQTMWMIHGEHPLLPPRMQRHPQRPSRQKTPMIQTNAPRLVGNL